MHERTIPRLIRTVQEAIAIGKMDNRPLRQCYGILNCFHYYNYFHTLERARYIAEIKTEILQMKSALFTTCVSYGCFSVIACMVVAAVLLVGGVAGLIGAVFSMKRAG